MFAFWRGGATEQVRDGFIKNKLAIQRSDCGFERRKTFAVEMNALARASDIQRSFLSGAGGGTRTHTSVTPTDFESASSTIPTHRQLFSELLPPIKQSRKLEGC